MLSLKVLNNVELEMAFSLRRDPCEVIYASLPDGYNDIVSMFIKDDYIIVVNDDLADKLDEIELIASVIHEGRHAYQWYQINHMLESKEDKELLDKWYFEFNNYNQPENENSTDYLYQEIEVDAIAYTAINLEKLTKTKLQIPKEIKNQVNNRINQIINIKKITD
ncbi:MAG: hypothetical protein KAU02_05130 [Tenericutes bacterium]|nr:hypothetical protein [Mycoplasmatota bacterium]